MESFESSFPADFRQKDIGAILKFASAGKFCQLVCIPGAGKATILRLLKTNNRLKKYHLGAKVASINFVYINLQELADFDENQILKLILFSLDHKIKPQQDTLALKKQIKETVARICKNFNIVLLLDHFDEVQHHLSRSFYQLLKDLKDLAKYKIAVVFATRRDLAELVDEQIFKDFWDFFVENSIYLKVNDPEATEFLFAQVEKAFSKKLLDLQKKAIINFTGGHAKLTKIIAELALHQNINLEKKILLANNQVRATLFEIWLFLTAQEQAALYTAAQKDAETDSEIFKKLALLDLINEKSDFTIPLFGLFIQTLGDDIAKPKITYDSKTKEIIKGQNVISELLSPQEYRLVKFLIENHGRVVERNELIEAVWPQAKVATAISDEAIDQMIFRLRKKIETDPARPIHIVTVKGRGILFNP